MKKWIITSLLLLLPYFYFILLNDELDLSHITGNIQDHSKWKVSAITDNDTAKIDHILNQPFTYLSEGGQSYVFASQDQKYVLKLFKFNRFKPHFLVQILPDVFPFKTYRDQHINKREHKLTTAFNGYKLAYDLHKEDSGLIALQLIPSNESKLITLTDKKNCLRTINLENVSYILQEKGEMLSTDLSNLLRDGNLSAAKKRLTQVLQLYLSEYQKGIYDLDHGVMHNIGCIGDRIFHLDGGKFISDTNMKDPEAYKKDLVKIASKLQIWIEKHYPEYSYELTKFLENGLSDIFQQNSSVSAHL